jgi:hypothetical protein
MLRVLSLLDVANLADKLKHVGHWAVLRRVGAAMSYKFRTRLEVNKEVNGNP